MNKIQARATVLNYHHGPRPPRPQSSVLRGSIVTAVPSCFLHENIMKDLTCSSTMFKQITVSAPSKVILHGEHAVVYGKSAVAASLDLRTKMYLTPLSDRQHHVLEVDFPDVRVKHSWKGEDVENHLLKHRPSTFPRNEISSVFLGLVQDFIRKTGDRYHQDLQLASLTCFFYLYSILCQEFVPMKIKVESDIPIGAGLGSSAALSVCLAAGLHAIQSGKAQLDQHDQEYVCQLAFLSEKILHGKPSGIDNAVSTYGGFLHFQNGCIEPIEPLKSINLRILLVNSHIARQTKDLVSKVKAQYDKDPSAVEPIFEAIHGTSKLFLETLASIGKEGDTEDKYTVLNDLICYNQRLLETLQVSHPSLDAIVSLAQSYGLCGKLTGAGGGGFAFILLRPCVNENIILEVKEKLSQQGFTCYEADLGVHGVRINSDNSICISQ